MNVPIVRQEIIRRERLLHYFQEIDEIDLILVSAPAGYGKTSLLVSWAEGCDHPVAWLSVDKGENNEIHFFRLLIEALRTKLSPNTKTSESDDFGVKTLNLIETYRQGILDFQPMEQVIASLIQELEGYQVERLWLVFDDYHLIDNHFIHHGLAYLLKYRPAFLHIVIATRSDPPIGLERMRACGQLVELRLDDLRFNQEEARIYLNDAVGLELTDADISDLVDRTEGWISALQLAAGALNSLEDKKGFIAALTGEFDRIAGFLAAEVFNNQTDELKTFLLSTSITDRLSGALCNELTGRTDGQRVLEDMRWTDIPLETLDRNQNLYRYQQLFADMLRQRLRNEDPEKFLSLHRRASRWFEEQTQITGDQEQLMMGIEHAIMSKDFQRVTDTLDQHALHLVSSGFESTLINWIDDLPIETTLPSPFLSAYRLYSMLATGNIHKAARHLAEAEEYIADTDPELSSNQAKLMALQAHISAHGENLDRSIDLSKTAIQTLPDNEPFWKTVSMVALAGAYMMKGNFTQAELLFEETLELSHKQDSPYLVSVTDLKYLGCLYYRGRLARIESIFENSRQQEVSSRLSERLFGGFLDSQYSLVLCEYNRLDQALTQAEKGLEKSERFENNYVLPISWLSMIQILFSRADWEGMDEAIHNLERISHKAVLQPWINNRLLAWKVRSLIAGDRLSKARSLLDQSGPGSDPTLHFMEEELNLAQARLLLAEQRFTEALDLLTKLEEEASGEGRTRKTIEVLLIIAAALIKGENLNAALATIDKALKIAEPSDYLQIFLDEGDLLMNLLRKAVESRKHTEYAKKILRAYSDSQVPKPTGAEALIVPLSQREWDVLALLEQRMTNDEIAAELVVSTSTVRTHLRSIFRKLDVHRRWDAVARARELDLFENT